jgi:hypothetical protein
LTKVSRVSLVAVFFVTLLLFSAHAVAFNDQIGWGRLAAELGPTMPDGSGISAQHVEGSELNPTPPNYAYMPNPSLSYFASENFLDVSGLTTAYSSHASSVGSRWYGSQGVSPAVGNTVNNKIYGYEANDWLTKIWNGQTVYGDIVNNSWIGGYPDTSVTALMLNKMDYFIRNTNTPMFSGVDNNAGSNSSTANALAWATYNGVAVGRSDGSHKSGRPNPIYGTASKPDLVAPESFTSYATPVVSGVGSMLLQEARDRGWSTVERPDVLKSVMMAGATKPSGWAKGVAGNPGDDETNPLDPVYGAGQVNVYNAYHILDAGEQNPVNPLVGKIGWDAAQARRNKAVDYFFQIDDTYGANLSAILTWLEPGSLASSGRSLTHDLNLQLYSAINNGGSFSLGTLIQQSISTQDNVEDVWLQGLLPGYYALDVSTLEVSNVDFSLAWMSQTLVPGDADRDGDVDLVDLGTLASNYGTTSGAIWSMGDFDMDGDVDLVDLGSLAGNYGYGGSPASPLNFNADLAQFPELVPEPATCAFLFVGLLAFVSRTRRRGK